MARLPVEAEAGGKSERLPKQLSRHLFPARADKAARRDLDGAVEEVLYERGAREKKARRTTEYGNGGVRTRPAGKRSESEPLPQRDAGAEEAGKKRGAKYVTFGRASSRAPEYVSTPASSRRPGRPYNLSGRGPGEEREGGSPGQFELSSGRDKDRERDRDEDRGGSRRGSGEGRDRERDSARKRRRRRDVVVEQEREPSWMKILREVSSIYD